MKLDYSILWIEDELDSIQDARNSITDFLTSHHFIHDITFVTSKVEADETINNAIKPYDLVVSDLNLDDHHGSEGIALISDLRSNQYFGDIILYSSSSLKDVLDKMLGELESTHPLIGVHMVEGRENELSGMIEDFINFFITKNLTIESARGFILAEISHIDAETNRYLLNELLNANNTDKNNLERIINKTLRTGVISSTNSRLTQRSITIPNVTTKLNAFIASATNHLGVVTSTSLCKILSEYLTLESCSYSNAPTGPYEALIHIRNDFAHKTNTALMGEHVDLRALTNRMREQFILHRNQLTEKGVL